MSEESDIVVRQVDLSPKGSMRQATDVAAVCRDIVLKTAQNIQGRKYVKVEGWLAIARAFNCTVGTRDVKQEENGISAIAEVRRISDGVVLAFAEGFVGNDEQMWARRPLYARRAMAQTRAVSRACRSAFAFVVVMIDEGLSTTPAEEMGADELTQPTPAAKAEQAETEEDFIRLRAEAYRDAKTPTQRALALKGLTPEQSKAVEAMAKGGPHAA